MSVHPNSASSSILRRVAFVALFALASLGAHAQSSLLNVSYDPTRELWNERQRAAGRQSPGSSISACHEVRVDFGAFGGGVIGGFNMTIADILRDQSDVAGRFTTGGLTCVPIAGPGSGGRCVEFRSCRPFRSRASISPATIASTCSGISIRIPLFRTKRSDPTAARQQSRARQPFGADITIPGSYFVFPQCEAEGLPSAAIRASVGATTISSRSSSPARRPCPSRRRSCCWDRG